MSTSVASVVSHFPDAENGFTTTLASTISSGAATVPLNSVAGYTNGEPAVFIVDPSDLTKKQTFTGIIDTGGVQVTSVVWTAGTNQAHSGGATVVDYPAATHMAMVSKGIKVQHNQSGTHSSITASGTLAVTGATTLTGAATIVGALTLNSYDGWITSTDTWVYASATTFTIAGVDRTAQLPVGTKIKLTQTTAKYFYVTAVAFSTNTTITITGGTDYTLANAAITAPNYSYDTTPQGFPQIFSWAPNWTNFTVGNGTLNYAKFSMNGKDVFYQVKFTHGSTTVVGTIPGFSTPVTMSSDYVASDQLLASVQLNDASGFRNPGLVLVGSTSRIDIYWFNTSITIQSITGTAPVTWTTSDQFMINGSFKSA